MSEHDPEENEFFCSKPAEGESKRKHNRGNGSVRGAPMMHVVAIVLSVVGVIALVLLAVAVIVALLSGNKDHWPP